MLNFIFKFLKLKYIYFNSYKNLAQIPFFFKITKEYLYKKQTLTEYKNYIKSDISFKVRESFLPIFISALNDDIINILDIGGQFNQLYDCINLSTKKKIDITVFETEIVYDIMNKSTLNDNNRYIKDIDELYIKQKKIDIVYFGSSFQYLLSFENFVSKIIKLNPKYIVITETIFLEFKEKFLTLQINTYPSIIPHQFNNIHYVEKFFHRNNFNLIYKTKRKPGKHNSLKKGEYFARDLIFKNIF